MACPTRRLVFLGCGLGLFARPTWGAELPIKNWRFRTDAANEPLSDALMNSLQAQTDLVEGLDINPKIKTFFHSVPLEIVPTTPRGPGYYSFETQRLLLSMQPVPPENPVLLHELLHAYHQQRVPDGLRNADVIRFFNEAKSSGKFPPQSYMLTNMVEFFAMCASVALWGQAARPPSTRADVREKLPEFYSWIVAEFSLTEK
jgi:hypothetical protein